MEQTKLPSRFQHGDSVTVSYADAGVVKNCQVEGVIFDLGKVYYDLTVKMTIDGEPYYTNLIRLDSAFVSPAEEPIKIKRPQSEKRKK